MPRGGRRLPRTHLTGASNRWAAIGRKSIKGKLADAVEVEHSPPELSFADPNDQLGDFKRKQKLLEAPALVRTRLGGTIMRPASRCAARRYAEVIDEHITEHEEATFVQRPWSNTQPKLGVPDWLPGEPARALAVYSVTDDVFD